MLIGISGKINSGKDTVGKIIQILTDSPQFNNEAVVNFLKRDLPNPQFINKKFADTLKDFICVLLGCTREKLEDRDFKEAELGEEWHKTVWHLQSNHNRLETYLSKEGAESDFSHYDENYNQEVYIVREDIVLTPRLLLQLMGTECGEKFYTLIFG